jgi:hypothetical protein
VAEAASNQAVAAAESSGAIRWFDTYAEAEEAASGLADNTVVGIWADEARGEANTRYMVQGGALEYRLTIGIASYGLSVTDEMGTKIVPTAMEVFRTGGYYTVGDGGGADFVRVDAEPSRPGKVQDASGAWFELRETVINPIMFGAKCDGVTPDQDAFNDMSAYV